MMAAPFGASSPHSAHSSWSRPSIAAEDMIDFFKVVSCPQTSNHNWSTCFYAHSNEKARRRSLAEHPYSAIFCVDMLSKGECKKGDECSLAHSVFEYWMHPEKFRTKFCKDGQDCARAVCFFAHCRQELRNPSTDYQARRLTGACSQHLQHLAHAINSSSISGQDLSRCTISSPGSHSSSNTLLSASAFGGPAAFSGYHVLTGAAGVGHNCSPSVMQAYAQSAAANLPMLMMNSSVGSVMPYSSKQTAKRILTLSPQQAGSSNMEVAALLQDAQQLPGTDADSSHAAHVAALQWQYDDQIQKAELAAARVDATSSKLQAFAAALGRSASSGTALNNTPTSGIRPTDWPALQHTRATAADGSAGELAAMHGVSSQHQAGVAGVEQCQQRLVPVVDISGSISYFSPTMAPQAAQVCRLQSDQYVGAHQAVRYDLGLMGLSQHVGQNVDLQPGNSVVEPATAAAAATNIRLEAYGGSEGMVPNPDGATKK